MGGGVAVVSSGDCRVLCFGLLLWALFCTTYYAFNAIEWQMAERLSSSTEPSISISAQFADASVMNVSATYRFLTQSQMARLKMLNFAPSQPRQVNNRPAFSTQCLGHLQEHRVDAVWEWMRWCWRVLVGLALQEHPLLLREQPTSVYAPSICGEWDSNQLHQPSTVIRCFRRRLPFNFNFNFFTDDSEWYCWSDRLPIGYEIHGARVQCHTDSKIDKKIDPKQAGVVDMGSCGLFYRLRLGYRAHLTLVLWGPVCISYLWFAIVYVRWFFSPPGLARFLWIPIFYILMTWGIASWCSGVILTWHPIPITDFRWPSFLHLISPWDVLIMTLCLFSRFMQRISRAPLEPRETPEATTTLLTFSRRPRHSKNKSIHCHY